MRMEFAFPMELEETAGNDGHKLVIHIARPEEIEEVYNFLLFNYFPMAPVRQLYQYDEAEKARKDSTWRPDWDFVQECLNHPYSWLVRDSTNGQLVYVQLATIEERKNMVDAAEEFSLEQRKKGDKHFPGWLLWALLAEMNKGVDLFTLFNTERILYIGFMAVSSQYANRGLGSKVNRLFLEWVKECGAAGAVKIDAFNTFVAKMMIKENFDTIAYVDYANFEIDGMKLLAKFSNELVQHSEGRSMARLL